MHEPTRRGFLRRAAGGLAAMALVPELSEARPLVRGAGLRVGLIGVGRQGRQILAELAKIEGVEVAAICDVVESRLKSGQGRAPGAAAFADHRAMLDQAKDVPALIIATPTHLHRAIALDCIQAGRHVYCEAPLATTIDDARAMASAARSASTVFHAGFQGRSNPVYSLARSFFKGNALRDVVGLRAQNHQKTTWRVPSADPAQEAALNWMLDDSVSLGLAGEWGSHQFDVFHYFLDAYPTTVRGRGATLVHNDGRKVHDTISLDLDFGKGVSLAYSATLANSYEGRYEALYGSMAAIRLAWSHGWMFKESDAPTQGWEVYANRQRLYSEDGITLIAGATKLAEQGKLKEGVGLPNSSLYYALADFVKSVAEGKPAACSADEGLRATVVGIRASEAVKAGGEVAIDPALLKGA